MMVCRQTAPGRRKGGDGGWVVIEGNEATSYINSKLRG